MPFEPQGVVTATRQFSTSVLSNARHPEPGSRSERVYRAGCELVADSMRAGREVRLRVTGSSMLPALWPGDVIVAREVNNVPPSVGDVLLFMRDGRLCAHRMVNRLDDSDNANGTQLIMRGDSADAFDPPMHLSEIIGRAVSVIRDGRETAVAAGEPSRAHRMVSFAIRHSVFLRRVLLKIHAMRRRSILTAETECRA